MQILPYVIQLVKLGFSGSAIALAFLAYRLILQEQQRDGPPRRQIISQIRSFTWFALALAGIMAVVSVAEMVIQPDRPPRVRDELSGYWMQCHIREDEKKMCSLVKIAYDADTETFCMMGYGFRIREAAEGKVVEEHSKWNTVKVSQIDEEFRIIVTYDYIADLYLSARKNDTRRSNRVAGNGQAEFTKDSGRYKAGSGWYQNEKKEQTMYTLERLETHEFPSLKNYSHHPREGIPIVKEYYRRRENVSQ